MFLPKVHRDAGAQSPLIDWRSYRCQELLVAGERHLWLLMSVPSNRLLAQVDIHLLRFQVLFYSRRS